jgi:hypothetical protein
MNIVPYPTGKVTYYNLPDFFLEYRPEIPGLYFKLVGFVPHKRFVEIYDQYLAVIKKYGRVKIITDTSQAKVLTPDSQAYNNEKMPEFLAHVPVNAVILPKDTFVEFMLNRMKHKAEDISNGDFQVEMFDNYENALDWIRTK